MVMLPFMVSPKREKMGERVTDSSRLNSLDPLKSMEERAMRQRQSHMALRLRKTNIVGWLRGKQLPSQRQQLLDME